MELLEELLIKKETLSSLRMTPITAVATFSCTRRTPCQQQGWLSPLSLSLLPCVLPPVRTCSPAGPKLPGVPFRLPEPCFKSVGALLQLK